MTSAEFYTACFLAANRGEMNARIKHDATKQEKLVLAFFFYSLNHQTGKA